MQSQPLYSTTPSLTPSSAISSPSQSMWFLHQEIDPSPAPPQAPSSSPRVSGACQDDARELAIRRPRFVERLSGVVEKLTGTHRQLLAEVAARKRPPVGAAAAYRHGQVHLQGAAARDQPRGDGADHKVGRPLAGLLLAGKGNRRLRRGSCDDVMRVREEG
ncbi:hypothetical protein B296_00051108 [Ensete ventricosum]|uniref:Uncharacterized protein n=1 Tax=Ensete ventricosum TaxID=4639 RepID=A0A426X040_ENSVE|nr:hypothetical protein B296_00051108 [Ensete ventricosum]